MHYPTWTRPRTSLLIAALTLTPSAAAVAQVAAGGGGRALDANQQAGGSGINSVENQVDYRVRNELLTGNVGGILGFQDNVGYTSSGSFQGTLGSDDLFDFRTLSIRSDVSQVNVPLGRGGSLASDQVVFRDFAVPEASGFDRNAVVQGGVFGVNPRTNNRTNNFTAGGSLSTVAGGGTTLGVLSVPDGGALTISADPLRGVVRQPVSRALAPGIDLNATAPNVRSTGGFGPSQSGGIPKGRGLAEGRGDGLQLGQLQGIVSGELQGTRAESDPQSVRDRVAESRERIFGDKPNADATPDPAGPVDNAYTRLLERMKNGDPQPNERGDTGEANRPGSSDDARGSGGPDAENATDLRPEWMKRLAEPPESRIEAAERRMQDQLERIRTGVQRDDDKTRAESGDTPNAARVTAEREEAAADLNNLLDRLDYDVRLETLVAQREGRAAKLYQSAEEDLSAGRFINAERTYRQLRLEDDANPLSRAGLVHAQLGAGMMRAAAFNLRGLFEAHPELIATRYGQNLLPPAERMVWLQGELQRSIDEAGASGQAGLMMAYLGHQVESRQLVRYGLAVAREADPDDALLPLVERIWLDPDANGGDGIDANGGDEIDANGADETDANAGDGIDANAGPPAPATP